MSQTLNINIGAHVCPNCHIRMIERPAGRTTNYKMFDYWCPNCHRSEGRHLQIDDKKPVINA